MSKRPKKRPVKRSTPTVADRARRDEKQALRRALQSERQIQWLARQLQRAVEATDHKLEALGGILRERFAQSEPDDEPAAAVNT